MSTTKETVLKEISEKFNTGLTYTGKNVKTILESVSLDSLKLITPPSKIKKGDVFVSYQGAKARPTVVIKVLKDDKVVCVPLTSTINVNTTIPYKSRFLGEGYFSNCIAVCSEQSVKKHFVGVFDNPKALNLAIKELSNFYKGIIW